MNLRKVVFSTILVCALPSVYICSGSYAYLDPQKLYNIADTVIRGTIIDVRIIEDAYNKHVIAEIEVEKYLKNPLESKIITVRSSERKLQEGVGFETQPIAQFIVGEKVIIYLEKISEDYFTPVGGFQGKFTSTNGAYINPNGDIFREPKPYAIMVTAIILIGIVVIGLGYLTKKFLVWPKPSHSQISFEEL